MQMKKIDGYQSSGKRERKGEREDERCFDHLCSLLHAYMQLCYCVHHKNGLRKELMWEFQSFY